MGEPSMVAELAGWAVFAAATLAFHAIQRAQRARIHRQQAALAALRRVHTNVGQGPGRLSPAVSQPAHQAGTRRSPTVRQRDLPTCRSNAGRVKPMAGPARPIDPLLRA